MEQEIWKDVSGYEGLYQVSNLGRVKALPKYSNSKGYPELRKERLLKPGLTGKFRNYPTVTFVKDGKSTSYKVHRLVAEAFIPNPNNYPMINHKDENTLNNSVSNLEWCTNSYNVKYSAKPLTDEHKLKISLANKGKVRSEEFINMLKNRNVSEQTRQKLREAALRQWRNKKHE